MASQPSLKHYDDETLDTLVQTLRDVCQVLEAHEPDPEGGIDPGLKKDAAFRLMVLVDAGIRDPQVVESGACLIKFLPCQLALLQSNHFGSID